MKHNCSIFHSHYKTEVSGATWSGKVAEQEEVPQEGDQAGVDRHHGLHHLLAASLGHPDSSDQVRNEEWGESDISQLMSSSYFPPIGKQFIGRKILLEFQTVCRLMKDFCISANLPATTRATPSLSSSSSPTACSTATPPSTPSSTLSSRTTSRRVSARRVTATRGRWRGSGTTRTAAPPHGESPS